MNRWRRPANTLGTSAGFFKIDSDRGYTWYG